MRIHIRVNNKNKWEDLSISGNASNELTLSKHRGIQTRNCLKRLFVERCGLQNSTTKIKVYSRVQKIYRNINRPANFRDWMNAVDSKPFETVVFWTSWLTVTSKRIRIYIRVKTKIYETGKTCQFKEMHQMRLTWSKHHGTHTRNDLKRLFFERCGLQSLKNKKWIYIRIKTKTRKMRGPVNNFKK